MRNPSVHVDGDVIRIVNGRSRGQGIVLLVAAAFMLGLLLAGDNLPDWLDMNPTEPGLLAFGIVLCCNAAFWWSVVTIDRGVGQLEIARRWGLFCSRRRTELSSYDTVGVRADSDGNVSVYLEKNGAEGGIEWNNDRAIVWGREYSECRDIVALVAKHLQITVTLHGSVDAYGQFRA